jgi:hypothetical protein
MNCMSKRGHRKRHDLVDLLQLLACCKTLVSMPVDQIFLSKGTPPSRPLNVSDMRRARPRYRGEEKWVPKSHNTVCAFHFMAQGSCR